MVESTAAIRPSLTVEPAYPHPVEAWRSIAVIFILYSISILDRKLLSLLIEPIKKDLSLTDVQMGLLYGAAFSVFYSVALIPLGWAVDRYGRRKIIAGGLVVWSLCTAACGFGRDFYSLFLARAGVGAGEAALIPASHSIVADSFPKNKLSLPMTIFGGATKIGTGLSFVLGGFLIALIAPSAIYEIPWLGVDFVGWQMIFLSVGIPGVLFALLTFLIHEPARTGTRTADRGTYKDLARFYRCNLSLMLGLHVGALTTLAVVTSITVWSTPFLTRSFGWTISHAAYWLAFVLTVGPLVFVPVHGYIVQRLFAAGKRDAHLWYLGATSLLAIPFLVSAFAAHSPTVTLVGLTVTMALVGAYVGLSNTVIQLIIPANLRGKASAVTLILVSGLATLLGPTIPPLITRLLFGDEQRIGTGVAIFGACGFAMAGLGYLSGVHGLRRHFRREDAAA